MSEDTVVFGRQQTAQQTHECASCIEPIKSGEAYLRTVVVPRSLLPETGDEHAQAQEIWDLVARQRFPVEKFHLPCAEQERRAGDLRLNRIGQS